MDDLDDVAAIASPAGRTLADRATAALDGGEDLLAATSHLRADGTDPHLVALALTQARLRRRARPRFGNLADDLLWTEAGLEQASRRSVAEHRAERYALSGSARVADLCCGVGGDLLALAGAGLQVLAVDQDPVTLAVAAENVRRAGVAGRVELRPGDAQTVDLSGCDAAFVDPARRTAAGTRTFDPDAYSPPFSFVSALAARVPRTGAKVAPGLPHDLVAAGAEAEWVSDGGEVKEAALWFGPLAGLLGPARRRATLLPSGATLVDDLALGPPPTGPVGRWLHEPDGAVVRAGLVAEAAASIDGRLVDPAIAYVSTDADVTSPLTRRFEVHEVLPFQLKRLRAALRAVDASDVVVKKRGMGVDPAEMRRRLRVDGAGRTWTVLLTRVGDDPLAVVALPADGPPATR